MTKLCPWALPDPPFGGSKAPRPSVTSGSSRTAGPTGIHTPRPRVSSPEL